MSKPLTLILKTIIVTHLIFFSFTQLQAQAYQSTPIINSYSGRVIDGLIAYYPFTEDSGLVVSDESGFATPLNLEFSGDGIVWLSGRNGVSVTSSASIKSVVAATKLHSEIVSSGSFTIEIWCKPASTTQTGPARMVSYSGNISERNFTMGQKADSIEIRLRTTSTDQQGRPFMESDSIVTTSESHYVLTYTAGEVERLYMNGVEVVSEARSGDFSNWDASYPLAIANEATGDRPWLGEVYLVAIYNRELSVTEVQQNFNYGPIVDKVNRAPESPVLISPNNRAFLSDLSQPIKFAWTVPNDLDGDSLHFKIEFDVDANFNSPLLFFESKDGTPGFFPKPPVSQAADSVTFEKVISLPNGSYWWRVSAWDGLVYGAPSLPQNFVIDTTLPNIDSLLLPDPKFPPNWYNPNTRTSLTFGVQYDEPYAQKAEFNLGSLGGVQSLDNIPSGSNQKAEITIDLTGKADGNYPLSVTVFDSAGNTSNKSTSIALDATRPSGTQTSSPDISSEEAFVVNWGNTGTDGNGSGLSGIYDVRVQINGGAWQDWLTDFPGTSETYQGSHGQTYGFEAVAYDNVGNVEAFNQVPESVTLVDTTADDISAPGPPVSLTAGGSNPSPWQKDPVFQIAWQEPIDPSGIDKALYKLGTPPIANFDTTGSVSGVTSVSIKATQENGENFYLWFSDRKGNVDFQKRGEVTLLYDNTAPTGTQASSPAVSTEESFLLNWGNTATDGNGSGLSGIYDVRVQINGGAWQDWLTDFPGTSETYQGSHGQTYGFEAVAYDNVGNVEAFNQVPESVTLVDTPADDISAHGPPVSLTAGGSNPSPWQKDQIFQITWQTPDDPSGIGRALYKLGDAPVTNYDTTGSVAGLSTIEIKADQEDGQNFYLWFVDGRGNVDYRNYGVIRLLYDSTLPEIKGFDILNADFQPNWYNQGRTSTAQVSVKYNEKHPGKLKIVSEGLAISIEADNLPSGANVSFVFNLRLDGKSDGLYDLVFTLMDSAGNQTKDTTTIALDSTPPVGAQTSSPATSSEKTFVVTWGGTATDGNGSGLSGFYDVKVQIDGGPWQDWLTDFPGTSETYPGSHGQTYGFEAVAYDNVGNVEPFSENPESVTLVDTTVSDINAPGPPVSLTAGGSNPSPWQKDAVFQITWQAPDDPSGISKALYKLGAAPVSDYDTTRSVTDRSTIDITVSQENGQNFYLWFVDGRGNVDFRNHDVVRLLYDGTVPEIKSIDVLNADFQLTWFNQGQTSIAEIRVNYSESHPQLLRLESTGLGTNIEVEDLTSGEEAFFLFNLDLQGQTDGNYDLAFTLIDSAGNQTKDTKTIALDNTPPVGARASSPPTSSQETFLVSWDGSATDGNGSGISGIYDVKVQINQGLWLIWLTNFAGTSAEFRGSQGQMYGFEVVARDNVGNVETFLDSAETITFVDTSFSDLEPPSISHTPTSIVEEGQSLSVQAQISDNIRVSEAVLFYKQSGKKNFQPLAMTDMGGGLFATTLTSDIMSTRGINYYIRASDGFNFAYHPTENWETKPNNVSVRISGTGAQGLVKEQAQPGGSTQTAFRMISVPLTLNNPSPKTVLEDDLGPYDPKQWRLFQFNPSTNNYSEFPNIDSFSPGKAFWLIVREPNKKIDSGVGTTVVTNLPFQISLKQGWNDISNPFNFPVKWSEVQVIQGSADDIMGPYTYQGQWLLPTQVTSLIPWEGYAIFSSAPNVVISIPPVGESSSQNNQSFAKIFSDFDWYINITAVCEEAIDGSNFIGSSPEAAAEWDKLDYLEPPAIGEFVQLQFPHDNWQKFRGNFTTDFRPPFKDGDTWNFEVVTNIKNAPITLRFKNLESLPLSFQAILIDLSTQQKIDIIQKTEYVFFPYPNSMKREFALLIGTRSYLDNLDELKQRIPGDFYLSQNFPNPFNAGTTLRYQVSERTHVSIKVLNILGQEIRQLTSKPQDPGFYQVHWDGKSQAGKEVGTGIYIIRLDAGSFQQTRKVILVR
jgi:hypothetical protein